MPLDQATYQKLYNDPEFARQFPTDQDRAGAIAHLDPEFAAMGPDAQLTAAKTMFSGPRFSSQANLQRMKAGGDIPAGNPIAPQGSAVKRFAQGFGLPTSMEDIQRMGDIRNVPMLPMTGITLNSISNPPKSFEGWVNTLGGPVGGAISNAAHIVPDMVEGNVAGGLGRATQTAATVAPFVKGLRPFAPMGESVFKEPGIINDPTGTPIYGPPTVKGGMGPIKKMGVTALAGGKVANALDSLTATEKPNIIGYNRYAGELVGPPAPPKPAPVGFTGTDFPFTDAKVGHFTDSVPASQLFGENNFKPTERPIPSPLNDPAAALAEAQVRKSITPVPPVTGSGSAFPMQPTNGPIPSSLPTTGSPPLRIPGDVTATTNLPDIYQGAPPSGGAAFGEAPVQPLPTVPGPHASGLKGMNLENVAQANTVPGTYFHPGEFANLMSQLERSGASVQQMHNARLQALQQIVSEMTDKDMANGPNKVLKEIAAQRKARKQ